MFDLKRKIKKFVACGLAVGSLVGTRVYADYSLINRIDVVTRKSDSKLDQKFAYLLNNCKLAESLDDNIFKGHNGEHYFTWCKLGTVGNKTYYALERGYPYDKYSEDWKENRTFVCTRGEVSEKQYVELEKKKVAVEINGKSLFETSEAFLAPSMNKYRTDGLSLYYKENFGEKTEFLELPLHLGYTENYGYFSDKEKSSKIVSNMLVVEKTTDGDRYEYPTWIRTLELIRYQKELEKKEKCEPGSVKVPTLILQKTPVEGKSNSRGTFPWWVVSIPVLSLVAVGGYDLSISHSSQADCDSNAVLPLGG